MDDIKDIVANTLLNCGVEPREKPEEFHSNVKALCDLMMMTKYGTKDPQVENLTLGSAIRKITEGNSLRINSYLDENGLRQWNITSIEEMDAAKVGQTFKNEDGEEVPYAPRQLGLAVKTGDLPEGNIRTTMLDMHFIKALNAISRALGE